MSQPGTLPVPVTPIPLPTARTGTRRLTDAQFQGLSAVPPEVERFASISNKATRCAYEADVRDFTASIGIESPEEFRTVNRPHVIARRTTLEERGLLSASTIRRKLSALSSLSSTCASSMQCCATRSTV